ncbi:MAG: four helix bundle protein [Bacteroidota bacterium]
MNQGFKNLIAYQKAYKMAMDIYRLTKSFPKEETYSLTDQIRRSSRSVCSNIGEGYRKRQYPKHFSHKLSDADGECSETIVWLDFCKDCGYINENDYKILLKEYGEVGKLLNHMINNPTKFSH